MTNDDEDDVMAELRAEYAVELPAIVAALAALIGRAGEGREAAARARAAAHRLRGTAGSYGFREVGVAAGEVEEAIDGPPAELAARMRALEAIARAG